MSINKNKRFQKLSFWQLLDKTSVQIPIIQRDYAQGRENQKKVRDKFIDALYKALTDGQAIELDFVYGSEQNDTLQPLDGQQRLTTLFLLHWYIACNEGVLNDEIRDRLSKFTYETRTSSREFCNELVNKGVEFEKDIELSKTIKNKSWFVMSWEKNPTISAMLTMLDAIHYKFKSLNGLWEKLTNVQNPSITFQYLNLENFGLSDDLYIKMNARGKQLTPFENFKAQFEKHIDDLKFEDKNVKIEEKLDTVWTDLFWKYKDENNCIDNKFINFIAGVAMSYYAQAYKSDKKDEIEQRIQSLANNPNDVAPQDFPTEKSFEYLVKSLNKYAEKQDNDEYVYAKLKPDITLFGYFKDDNADDNALFQKFIEFSEPHYKPRVLFYAQTEYLCKNTFDQDSFSDWMRVVRNIVENSTIDSASTFISAIGLVNELSKKTEVYNNIYEFLSTKEIKIESKHASEQVKEEIEKAKLIIRSKENRDIIHVTEDTNFCKGKIDFALYCVDYDIDNNPDTKDFKVEDLEKICKVFDDHLSESDISNEFRRALLTIGDNDFYNYWGTWSYGTDSHKRCFIENTADLKYYFTQNKLINGVLYDDYLRDLLLKLSEKSLDKVFSFTTLLMAFFPFRVK